MCNFTPKHSVNLQLELRDEAPNDKVRELVVALAYAVTNNALHAGTLPAELTSSCFAVIEERLRQTLLQFSKEMQPEEVAP